MATAAVELTAAFVGVKPRVADELPLRVDPLRSQWEARGPGLLAAMRRLSTADLLVPAAGLVLVHPRWGAADWLTRRTTASRSKVCWLTPSPSCPKCCAWAGFWVS